MVAVADCRDDARILEEFRKYWRSRTSYGADEQTYVIGRELCGGQRYKATSCFVARSYSEQDKKRLKEVFWVRLKTVIFFKHPTSNSFLFPKIIGSWATYK